MARKRKFAKSIQQEGISRDQISERLKEFGWIPSPTNIDLGEDFIVHIYIDGNPTGKTFHLQAKSVTNIDERKKKNFLVYQFKKQDIFDWEYFEDPVVLLVWDIKQRTGKWVLLDDVIRHLENTNPQWRSNKSTVNVFIPWINTTDDKGLMGLRERIAIRMLPIMLSKRDFSIQLKDEEAEVHKELESLSKSGGVFVTSGRHFNFPNWFIRWFDPNNFTLTFESKLSSEPLYFKIIAVDLDGQRLFHDTELLISKQDESSIVFSNEQLNSSIKIEFKLLKNTERKQYDYYTNLSVNNFGKTVYETRDILLFLRAFITGNKRTMVFSSKDGETSVLEGDDRKGVFPEDLNGILIILDKLCRIQDNMDFQISYPQDGVSEKDLKSIERLYQAIDKGKVELKSRKFEIELQKQGIETLLKTMGGEEKIDGRFQLSIDSHFTLFGNDVRLGRLVRFISGKIDQTRSELLKIIDDLEESGAFEITIHEPRAVDLYVDLFLKEAKRIAGLLHRKYNSLSVFLIGSLAWEDRFDINTKIQLALSNVANLEEVASYCKDISNYPLELYQLSDLPNDVVEKINNVETRL